MTKLVCLDLTRTRASQVGGTKLITHFPLSILHSYNPLDCCPRNWPIHNQNIIVMKTLKHFSISKWRMRWGNKGREKRISECEEKSTQTESGEVRKTQENSSQVRDDEIPDPGQSSEKIVEKDAQDEMRRGAVDKSVIYHELDFSLKNPILYCNNGGIIVRSKYTASKPPSSGGPSSSIFSSPTPKQVRMNKAKSCGFDIVQGKINRPGVELTPVKNGKSQQDLRTKKPDSKLVTPIRTPTVSPKFKKNEKGGKKTSYHGFFRTKKFSQQSLGCDREKKDEDDDYMFLDFSKNVKERSRNRTMKICGKTSTL